MEDIAHLYKITNTLTGEYYIGKHKGWTQKAVKHSKKYWGSGNRIRNYTKKHGTKNLKYEILCYGTTEFIYFLEGKYVTKELIESDEKCMNLMIGGFIGSRLLESSIKKNSEKQKGRPKTEEHKEKLRKARAKQLISKESYEKSSKTMSTLVWMNDGNKSYRVRPENYQDAKNKGLIEGRARIYVTENYRKKFTEQTKKQWQKVKETGHKGNLIKVS